MGELDNPKFRSINIMGNTIEKLNSLTTRKVFNYLEDPLLSAYFLSKEVKAYYLSLKHVDIKRDYHAQLIFTIKEFLSLVNKTNIEILNFYIFSKSDSKLIDVTNLGSSVTIEKIHPKGCELLEIKFPLTLESLKKFYKKAAMKHHPDRGGSHENMLIINKAYTAYQDYLCGNFNSVENVLEQEFSNSYYAVPHDANDYIYLLNSLLSEVYCDEWDLTNSYKIVKKLQNHEFYGSVLIETGEEVYKLVKMASILTKRLAHANRNSEANEMMDFTKFIYQIGKLNYKPYIEEPENIINRVKTLRVVINHIRQADNALEHNIISKIRYDKLLKKFGKKKEVEIDKGIILKEFLDSSEFIEQLVYDKGAIRSSSNSINIPEIGYGEDNKLHNLSKDQQAEYFLAFSNKSSLSLVRKYTYVRLASYILSIELESDKKSIDNICNELILLSKIFDTPHRKDSATLELIKNLSVDINKIKYLSKLDRMKKVEVIKNNFSTVICDHDSTFTVNI